VWKRRFLKDIVRSENQAAHDFVVNPENGAVLIS